jgi:hypothetical protein
MSSISLFCILVNSFTPKVRVVMYLLLKPCIPEDSLSDTHSGWTHLLAGTDTVWQKSIFGGVTHIKNTR